MQLGYRLARADVGLLAQVGSILDTPNRDADILLEFTKLRQHVRSFARAKLEKANPQYAESFLDTLARTNDFVQAQDIAAPLLRVEDEDVTLGTKVRPVWNTLLTATFDFELALDKTKRAVLLLRLPVPRPLDPHLNTGAWAIYHWDHWLFSIDALLDRLDKLIKLVCRSILRPKRAYWQQIQKRLSDDVQVMKEPVSKLRDPLAHGEGGGVKGPEEEHLWEPGLLADADLNVVYWTYQVIESPDQMRWHESAVGVTTKAIDISEAIFKELNWNLETP